jgi:hypothetical protein
MRRQKLCGSNLFFVIWASHLLKLLNSGVITWVRDILHQILHGRMKHVEVDFHFVSDRVAHKLLEDRFISTKDQIADGFTKAISHGRLLEF